MKIERIYISLGHNFVGHHGKEPSTYFMDPVDQVECVAGRGLQGDRYFGHKENYKGQITFFEAEIYEKLCEELQIFDRDMSVFRRNVITRNVDLNTWIGKPFEIQGVEFVGTEECSPCYWMDRAFGEGALKALRGHGGLRARILTDGVLRVG